MATKLASDYFDEGAAGLPIVDLPVNLTPADSSTVIKPKPTLVSAGYNSLYGKAQAEAEFIVWDAAGTSIIQQSGVLVPSDPNLPIVEWEVPVGLALGTNFRWSHKFKSVAGEDSVESEQTTFTVPANYVNKPSITAPTADETGVFPPLAATSNAFSYVGAVQTQDLVQWVVYNDEDLTDIFYDSGNIATDFQAKTIEALVLGENSYWITKRDSGATSGFGEFADAVKFTTDVAPSTDPVRTPTNTSPTDTETGVSNPTLVGDNYAALYNLGHDKSQFRVSTTQDMQSLVYDSGFISPSISHTVGGGILSVLTQYYWDVRYRNTDGVWSLRSTATTFTTGAVLTYLSQPTITYPTEGLTEVSRQPTLTGSAFNVVGGTDSHISSRWEVSTDVGFINLIHDTGFVGDLTSYTLPFDTLVGLTTYYVRVTYVGGSLGETESSPVISFVTTNLFVDWHSYDGTADGATMQTPTSNSSSYTTELLSLSNDLLAVLSDQGVDVRTTMYRKVDTNVSILSSIAFTTGSNILGGFPYNNSVLLDGSTLRVYEEDGINFDDKVVSPTLTLPSSRPNGSKGYAQYSDKLFYVGNSNTIYGFAVDEAGVNVSWGSISSPATTGRIITLSPNKIFLLGGSDLSSTNYSIATFTAGGVSGTQIDTVTRSTLTHDVGAIVIEWFSDDYVGVFRPNGSDDMLVDVYSVDEGGLLAQVSVDHVIGDLSTTETYCATRVTDTLNTVMLFSSDGNHVVSYDSDLDIVAIEAEVVTPRTDTNVYFTEAVLLADKNIFCITSDGSPEKVQIISARV